MQVKGQHAIHTTAAILIPAIEIKPDEWAAIVWMCQNQLGRRSITDEQRAFLIGQEYDAQKKTQGTNNQYIQAKSESGENLHFQNSEAPRNNKTRFIVAKTHGITEGAVKAAVAFTHGLDAAEAVSPGIKDAVLTGELKATKAAVAAVAKLPEADRPVYLFLQLF